MPTINAPFGFKPIRGCIRQALYYVPASDSTALYVGDPVIITGTANSADISVVGSGKWRAGELPVVTRSTAGSSGRVTGVITAVLVNDDDDLKYRAASTERVVLVANHPDQEFEVQMDSSTAITEMGGDANFSFGSGGSAVTGLSGAVITGVPAAAADAQFYVRRLKPVVNNKLADPYPIVLGKFKLHTDGYAAVAGV